MPNPLPAANSRRPCRSQGIWETHGSVASAGSCSLAAVAGGGLDGYYDSAIHDTMKAFLIFAASAWPMVVLGADTVRPDLQLRTAEVARERVWLVSSTNNISVFVPFKAEPPATFVAFVWTNTVHPRAVSVSVDGARVADAASLTPLTREGRTIGVGLLFVGKYRSDAERVAKALRSP